MGHKNAQLFIGKHLIRSMINGEINGIAETWLQRQLYVTSD